MDRRSFLRMLGLGALAAPLAALGVAKSPLKGLAAKTGRLRTVGYSGGLLFRPDDVIVIGTGEQAYGLPTNLEPAAIKYEEEVPAILSKATKDARGWIVHLDGEDVTHLNCYAERFIPFCGPDSGHGMVVLAVEAEDQSSRPKYVLWFAGDEGAPFPTFRREIR